MADEGSEQTLRNNLHIIQSMIDVSAERLEGLRTQCATSAELTQQEIRTLEVMQYLDILKLILKLNYLNLSAVHSKCQFSGKIDKTILRSACDQIEIEEWM